MQTVADIRERESLSDIVDVLLANDKDARFLSFVQTLMTPPTPVIAQKHEWKDIVARAITISLTASANATDWDTTNDITALPCAAAECAKLRVGDILLLADDGYDSEQVVVKSIDATGETIDLIARGHGSSTAAVQGEAAFTARIIGNAQDENDDPIAANFNGETIRYNYTQIFEDVVSVSGTVRRSRAIGGDEHDVEVAIKLNELMRCLNRSVIYGLRNLDATNKKGTLGGVREFLSGTYNINGAISIVKLEAMAAQMIAAGGTPSSIHVSPVGAAAITGLYVGNVRYETGQNKVGIGVSKIILAGQTVEVYPDRDVADAEVLMIDRDRVFLGALEGGKYENGNFALYPLLDKRHGKQHATQLLGEYTVEVKNPAGAGVRGYGRT